uniref:Uncharacterized protein n=1 Tax=Heterorhabditis bacteriophora TaxID=37862 RepID=A0A1I7WL91_HETBA
MIKLTIFSKTKLLIYLLFSLA